MVEINEKSIIGAWLTIGLQDAMRSFEKVNSIEYGEETTDLFALFDRDFEDFINNSDFFKGEIEVFYLSKNINLEILDELLTLIKKKTASLGLRIIRKQDFLYVYLDNVINKEVYYADDETEKYKIKKSLGCKY